MEIKKFENRLIAFDLDNEMVNATDMIRNYPNKNMGNFLRNKQTKEFITALESDMLFSISDSKSDTLKSAIVVKRGGKEQGTWMHKLLAYKFAGWLDSTFEIFVYKVFDNAINEKLRSINGKLRGQQRELDYFWDREDNNDLYNRKI